VAALAEHGARIAAQPDVVTARFGRVADIAREAEWLAREAGDLRVTGDHVRQAVRRTKERAGLPARHYRDRVRRGVLRIAVDGTAEGQINGLATTRAGQLTYGFPSRISATVGPGSQGAINIEGEADLSGAIHTKAFHIVGGVLRTLLPTAHPLVFDASLAFEQSYGGIDGDSASGAETVVLLSALTGLPLRQGIAMTGAIDQHGHILPIGAVNEKIEGFFDVCEALGLTGSQGVVIPASNVGDLMLRHDVVEACRAGRFSVWPVAHVRDALTLFTGIEAGTPDEAGRYPAGSVLARAMAAARRLWERGQASGG
jgi:ATP-dependent Lon protease